MKHYDYIEWTLYKRDLLDTRIYNEMEEHLFQCGECMDIFLSLIDEEEIEEANNFVPEDFTENLMGKIEKITPIKQGTKKKRKKKTKFPKDLFLYYTATAAVAIVLTAGGVFTTMVNSLTTNIKIEEEKLDPAKVYKISEKITKGTSNFIYNFNFMKNKEVK